MCDVRPLCVGPGTFTALCQALLLAIRASVSCLSNLLFTLLHLPTWGSRWWSGAGAHPHPHPPRGKQRRVPWQRSLPPFLGGPWTHLQLLQVGPLYADHSSQQLVLQAIPGHCKVDQSGLSLQLRWVVRTGQLGVKDEPELGVVFPLFVSNFNEPGT